MTRDGFAGVATRQKASGSGFCRFWQDKTGEFVNALLSAPYVKKRAHDGAYHVPEEPVGSDPEIQVVTFGGREVHEAAM